MQDCQGLTLCDKYIRDFQTKFVLRRPHDFATATVGRADEDMVGGVARACLQNGTKIIAQERRGGDLFAFKIGL
ncbi:hypothetical protein CVM52_22180 [Pseudooceanicola lipolyticus]|uniref:Uncharacterized protein n=1 Tax=Pseudooceanicola lipolyticus TaxID=2029104 RepID=A0A2M8IVB0_9RHOB|nr:hypothetical protein CVM52_22180 [Pseudooceanicola lipolyticus]